MAPYRPTIAVHIVWHPACSTAEAYAQALFAHVFEDPASLASHGLRIPVRFWRSDPGDSSPPPPSVPPIDEAERSAIVILIDDAFIAEPGWLKFLDVVAEATGPDDEVLCVSLTSRAVEIDSPVAEHNFIRLDRCADDVRELVLLNRVTHALCRLVSGSERPVCLFLSHAKADGVPIAQRVRSYLQSGTGLDDFFDTQDIVEGAKWAEEIRGAAAENVLLAIRTDAYAAREWCRTEILHAKAAGSPLVVLDALEDVELRAFPYLGNAPSVRWRGSDSALAMEGLLCVVLRETLRFRHFPKRVIDLCRAYELPEDNRVLAAPPELLTVLQARNAGRDGAYTRIVYPDPPLGTDELALVTDFAPELETITPTALIARP